MRSPVGKRLQVSNSEQAASGYRMPVNDFVRKMEFAGRLKHFDYSGSVWFIKKVSWS